MLSNAYFLAKFRFDAAENEPAKNLQKFANFPNFLEALDLSIRRPPVHPVHARTYGLGRSDLPGPHLRGLVPSERAEPQQHRARKLTVGLEMNTQIVSMSFLK